MEGIYASGFQVLHNVYDVKIEFNTREPQLDENGNIIGEIQVPKSRMTISPALAKELAEVLSSAVADYEEKFGSIPKANGSRAE